MTTFQIDFQPGGIKDVQQAFKTVLQATLDASRGLITSAKDGAGAWQMLEREIVRNRNRTLHAIEKVNREIERDAQRAADKEVKIAEKAAADRARVEENYQKVRHHTEERYRQEAEFREQNSLRSRALATLKGQARGAAAHTMQAGMGYVGEAARAATDVFGGFSIADSVARMNKFQSSITNMSNSTYIADAVASDGTIIKGTKRAKAEDIDAFAKTTAIKTGIDKTELVGAWQSFIEKASDSRAFNGATQAELKAGRAEGKSDAQINADSKSEGQQLLLEMAELSKATGSNLTQVMDGIGMMKAANPNITSSQMAETMRMVVGQGKLGSVSMADLAKSAPTIMSGAGSLAMGMTEGQRALLGLSQVAMISSKSGAQAATGVARFMGYSEQKHDKLKALGVETRDKSGNGIKDPAEIVADIYRASKGDGAKMAKFQTIYGAEGYRVISGAKGTYQEAEIAAKKSAEKGGPKYVAGEAGAKAVLDMIQRVERMSYSKKDVADDLTGVKANRQEQFNQAKMAVQESIETAILPALNSFAKVLPEITPKIVAFIDFLTKNPMEGAGLLIGASIAKQMAPQMMQSILTTALGGAGGPVAVAVVAGMIAWKATEAKIDADKKLDADRSQLGATAEGHIQAAMHAKTPEAKAAALKQLEEDRRRVDIEATNVADGKGHSDSTEAMRVLRNVLDFPTMGLATKYGPLKGIGDAVDDKDNEAKHQKKQLAESGADLDVALGVLRDSILKAAQKTGDGGHVPMSDKTSPLR